jgi:glutamate-ammonia-ligase adenylyltransferase
MLENLLKDAASSTPDPERALKNLRSFCESNPELTQDLTAHIREISLLFSVSQFLANFSISKPDDLFESIRRVYEPVRRDEIAGTLTADIQSAPRVSRDSLFGAIRVFKRKRLLLLTLRDVLNVVDIVDSMLELSLLADVIVEESLRLLREDMRETYGDPKEDAFSVIAVGKLGGNELNYSSDIDLLYVYGTEAGETSGVATAGGVVKNRISNHEYYCKLGERLNRLLSANTEEGFAYRADLRLRPEGQRGSLAISLSAYETYYESWGREWERAVLLRARPVGGDAPLGKSFMDMIRPFVYRKYLDFGALDEIRRMKTKIDAVFKKDDIKRGYGGIREIEFFVHALQLIYGGKEQLLRERSTLKALHRLLQKNLVGHEDYLTLSENYLFLRKLEHRLQQMNDLQTHVVPSGAHEREALGGKMGLPDGESFLRNLEARRKSVRSIYDSLFVKQGTSFEHREAVPEADPFFAQGLSVGDIRQLLSGYSLEDAGKAARNIQDIREVTSSFQTLRGRRLLDQVLPVFLREALKSLNPDLAINNLHFFATVLASEESYLELFAKNEALISTLTRIFSRSQYLMKKILKRTDYLESLGHELFTKRTFRSLRKEMEKAVGAGTSLPDSIRMTRQMEEIRLGTLFLDGKIDVVTLIKGLSKTAEAVVSLCADKLISDGFAAIGMGKIGGREITFDSDLDLIFVCRGEVTERHVKAAERFIRLLTSYTKDGVAYRVDVRLRPDGTKGPLVSTLDALYSYYSGAAHFWEFQALLKARPVAGDKKTRCGFMRMREEMLKRSGREVSPADIRGMRERILKELAREREGLDIKLGRGGIEELEFTVQYLQLINGGRNAGLFVQGTIDALKRLTSAGMIGQEESGSLREAYLFYRTLESFMRLREEVVLRQTDIDSASEFMGFGRSDDFMKRLDGHRERVRDTFEKFLR